MIITLPRYTQNEYAMGNVRFGSVAAPQNFTIPGAAFGYKADITLTLFTDDLRLQWGPSFRGRVGANFVSLNIALTQFDSLLQF